MTDVLGGEEVMSRRRGSDRCHPVKYYVSMELITGTSI